MLRTLPPLSFVPRDVARQAEERIKDGIVNAETLEELDVLEKELERRVQAEKAAVVDGEAKRARKSEGMSPPPAKDQTNAYSVTISRRRPRTPAL